MRVVLAPADCFSPAGVSAFTPNIFFANDNNLLTEPIDKKFKESPLEV